MAVVIINIAIGLLQEGKAEKAAEAIKAMLSPTATVVRDGKMSTVEADQLVPGDVVIIRVGERLPADMRLLEVNNLQVGFPVGCGLAGLSSPWCSRLLCRRLHLLRVAFASA